MNQLTNIIEFIQINYEHKNSYLNIENFTNFALELFAIINVDVIDVIIEEYEDDSAEVVFDLCDDGTERKIAYGILCDDNGNNFVCTLQELF